jgi:hypothetical protein
MIKMRKACCFCKRTFSDSNALRQHLKCKHFFQSLVLDENLSSRDPAVINLAEIYDHQIFSLPSRLRGESDESIIHYVKKAAKGLVTRDKLFAKKAVYAISPVYLIVHHKSIDSIVRLN